MPRIFESGGTTGAPKRTAQLPDWLEQVTCWQIEDFTAGGFVPGRGLLCLMPSGPHGVGHFDRVVAERLGSIFHPSTWIRAGSRSSPRGALTPRSPPMSTTSSNRRGSSSPPRRVANLHATPPLLEAIARDDALVDLVNDKIRYILLSGAHVDVDTLDLLRDIFPGPRSPRCSAAR